MSPDKKPLKQSSNIFFVVTLKKGFTRDRSQTDCAAAIGDEDTTSARWVNQLKKRNLDKYSYLIIIHSIITRYYIKYINNKNSALIWVSFHKRSFHHNLKCDRNFILLSSKS